MSQKFVLSSGGLLIPGSAASVAPPPDVVYIRPYFNRKQCTLACWAQRGLIVLRDQNTGAERRIALQPFRQRLKALEQILEQMYRQDYPFPDYRQQLAETCEKLRRVLRKAEEHGDLETPGAPEYHRDHGPKRFYLKQGLPDRSSESISTSDCPET